MNVKHTSDIITPSVKISLYFQKKNKKSFGVKVREIRYMIILSNIV